MLSEEREGEVTDYIYLGNKLLAKKTSGETFWYLTDHLGSTIMLTEENGDVVWNEGYTAFGEKAGETGFDLEESGRYTGKDYDEDTGLYYYNARWYDASLGRFITEDPIRDSHNWYACCVNNPVRFIDPWGLRPEDGYVGDTESETTEDVDSYTDHDGNEVEIHHYDSTSGADYTVMFVKTTEGTDVTAWRREDEEGNGDVSVDISRESNLSNSNQDLNTWEALAGVELFSVGGYLTTAGILVATGSTAGFSSSITAGLVLTGVTASGVVAGTCFIFLGATTIAVAIDLIEGDGVDKTMDALDKASNWLTNR